MKHLLNVPLMNELIDAFHISDYFSSWTQYQPELISYDRGDKICGDGFPLCYLLFVVSGEVKVYTGSSEGKLLFLDTASGFKILGEMEFAGALTGSDPIMITANAVTDVLCVGISLLKYKSLLENDLLFNRYLVSSLAQKLKRLSQQSQASSLYPMNVRLGAYLLSIEQNRLISANWTKTSAYLGISYRQLMRILNQFCADGILKKSPKKGCYIIENIEILRQISSELFS